MNLAAQQREPNILTAGAQVSNTPFAMYKNSAFAAGINTPLIVYNPKLIKDPGSIRTQYVNVSDITPTVYDVSRDQRLLKKLMGLNRWHFLDKALKKA